ncbi:MAG: glycosyltransferase family 1 protein [Porphyromonas sp.]|nr:glycosyltransferase family 1 protein [Porphyromonas sp.]
MNIAFDAKRITNNATGLGNYSRFVVQTLAEYYPENNYLLCSPSAGNPRLYEHLLDYRSVSLQTPETALGQTLGTYWRNWGLKKMLREEEVDIYHGLSNELPIGLYNYKHIGTVLTMHDLAFVRYPQFYKAVDRLLYTRKYGASARHADHVVAVSEYTRQDVIEYFGVEPERVSVVYQGCSPIFAAVKPEQAAFVRGHYQLPERYMLFVGSIEERKNLLLAVEALAQLRDKSICLVAVGRRTPYVEQVLATARRLGVDRRLRMFHSIPNEHLPGFYAAAALFVYPSRFEGFGIPLIEALNAGVPVIGARGSCLEEAGGPHSLYTSPDDAEELADMMQRILDSDTLAQEMIEEGKIYAKRFSPKSIMRELRNVYENVLLTHD